MSQYFPKPYKIFEGNINVKVDLSDYATKSDIKNISNVDTKSFASKTNLASLKTEVDKLHIGKLVPVPVDLNKLSDVVKNDVIKKAVYDKLVEKVNNIDTSRFVLKIKYQTDQSELDKKNSDVSKLVKKTNYNNKIIEIENKTPSISGLAINAALTAVENKIPNISSLIKKKKNTEIEGKHTDHNHDKYITTLEFNKLTAEHLTARLKWADLVTKTDSDDKLRRLYQKTKPNETMHLLVENELKKLKIFDSSYFRRKSHFEEDGTQNYLVLQPVYRSFKRISGVAGGNYIYFLKSAGLSDERIDSITASSHKVIPQLSYYGTKTRVEFIGTCLKQGKATFNDWKIVNIYIVYEISKNFNISSYPTLENCLFGAVSLAKNADIDQCKYFGYGIGFDRHRFFSHPNDGTGKYVILFGGRYEFIHKDW